MGQLSAYSGTVTHSQTQTELESNETAASHIDAKVTMLRATRDDPYLLLAAIRGRQGALCTGRSTGSTVQQLGCFLIVFLCFSDPLAESRGAYDQIPGAPFATVGSATADPGADVNTLDTRLVINPNSV